MINDQELTPHIVDVPLFAGQNSSVDARIIDVGASPLVENGMFQTRGQVQKRYGFASLPMLDTRGNTLSQTRQVLTAGVNNALFVRTNTTLYAYNGINKNWIPLGGINAGAVRSVALTQSKDDIAEISSAATAQATAVAWSESGAIRVSVYEPLTGVYFQSATLLSRTGQKPNVSAIGNDFFVAYVENDTNTLVLVKVPGNNLAALGNTLTLSTALGPGAYYDMCAGNGNLYVATSEVGTNTKLKLQTVNSTPAITATVQVDHSAFGPHSTVWCAVSNATAIAGNASCWMHATNSSGPYEYPFPIRRVTAVGALGWAETQSTAHGNTQHYLRQVVIDPVAGTMAATSISYFTNPDCYLATRAFVADNAVYVWALADFKLQSQLLLLDATGRAVGRALTNGNAAPVDTNFTSLPTVAYTTDAAGDSNGYFAARKRARLKFDVNGNAFTSIGGALINLQYGDANAEVQAVNVGGTAYFGGAAPMLYDGRELTELSFWNYADTPTLTVLPSSGYLSAGSYTYAIGYAWTDNQGKIWRSPIILVPAGNSQPNGSSGATVTVPANAAVSLGNLRYLQGSLKQHVVIEIYRTAADLTQLYKIGEIDNNSALNSLTTSYADALADTAIVGEVCYTDGSNPPYIAPPGLTYLTATPDRLYGLATETGEIWVTNQSSSTVPAQFLLGQVLSVPMLSQAPTCFEIMDGNLYIFNGIDAILTTSASGASITSSGTILFDTPRALPVDAGCDTPTSLLHTESGIWYQSSKGMTLLDRGQTAEFVGDAVKNYSDTVLSAAAVPSQQQLRFTQAGQILVYDYVYKMWSVYTGHTPISACRWGSRFAILTASGVVKEEKPGTFTDDGLYYPRRIITPWIKPAGINGYARCWRFVILGEGRAPHTLQVRIAYQYDETFVDTLQIPSTAANPNSAYGASVGRYGAGKRYGHSAPNAYQFEAIMPRQKASAFKFEITDQADTGSGEASALTVLSLQVGVMQGLARLASGKRTG